MDILSYLSELIQTRKTVGIAGLGTVYKKKLPGRYDAATHSFVPPSYTLHFTSEIKEDILLPAYISKQRNVSTDTSNYFINEFSESLLQELNDHQEAQFGDLGKLVKTGDEIVLVPSERLNYGFDFYGLPSIKADDAVKEEVPEVEEEIPESAEQESAVEELIPEIQDVEDSASEETATDNSYPLIEEVEVEELDLPEEIVLPEPEEEPTIESVIADNEGMEENPGDDELNDHTEGINRKDEQQLRAEIEALNFYRSQTPVSPPSIPEQEEVITKLNAQTETVPAAEIPVTYPADVYPAAPESKSIPLYLKLILALSIIAMMMVVAYFVKPEWFNFLTGTPSTPIHQKVKPATLPAVDTTKTSMQNADSLKSTVAAAPATLKKDSPAVSAAPVKQSLDTAVVFEIIGASMHDQKEADGFIAQMKKSGITAKVVTNMSGRRLKMSIATLKDEEAAQLEMKRLAEKLKIKGMYIYKNKQK